MREGNGKMDVFVRTFPLTMLRKAMLTTVLSKVVSHAELNLRVIAHEDANQMLFELRDVEYLSGHGFWNASRIYADKNAISPVYALLDDDHLPIGREWFAEGARLLDLFPNYRIISSVSVCGEVHPDGGDSDVCETGCCGTPYFARAGTLHGFFPPCEISEADLVASREMTKVGKIGFGRKLRHNHLGFGFSQAVPGWWETMGRPAWRTS